MRLVGRGVVREPQAVHVNVPVGLVTRMWSQWTSVERIQSIFFR